MNKRKTSNQTIPTTKTKKSGIVIKIGGRRVRVRLKKDIQFVHINNIKEKYQSCLSGAYKLFHYLYVFCYVFIEYIKRRYNIVKIALKQRILTIRQVTQQKYQHISKSMKNDILKFFHYAITQMKEWNQYVYSFCCFTKKHFKIYRYLIIEFFQNKLSQCNNGLKSIRNDQAYREVKKSYLAIQSESLDYIQEQGKQCIHNRSHSVFYYIQPRVKSVVHMFFDSNDLGNEEILLKSDNYHMKKQNFMKQLIGRPSIRIRYVHRLVKIMLVFAMVLSTCMFGSKEAFAATANKLTSLQTRVHSSYGDVFIGGNYIELGVSCIGSFGTKADAPNNFHNTADYLMEKSWIKSQLGMVANEKGWFSSQKSKTSDFFMPGIVDEAWVIGINKSLTAIASSGQNNTQNLDSNFNSVILKDNSGQTIGVRTTGTIFNGKIQVTQDILLGVDDKLYTTNVNLKNISGENLTNVRYMRAFDPDQNSVGNTPSMYTHNYIQNTDNSAKLIAYGALNQAPFIFYAPDSRATVGYARNGSNDVFAFTDVYNNKGYMKTTNNDDVTTKANYMDGDIFIYFDLGTMSAGSTSQLTYYSSLDADVSHASDRIDGKAVDDFIEETVPKAEDITSTTIKEEKPKVDEAKDRFDDLSDEGKDIVSQDSKDKLTEAEKKVDKIIKEDYLQPVIDGIKELPDSKDDLVTIDDLKKLEDVVSNKDKYDDLVMTDKDNPSKDTWLTEDKFSPDEYQEVLDALQKLDNLTANTPTSTEAKSYTITFHMTDELGQKTTHVVDVIEGKSYTYQINIEANQTIEITSGTAKINGNDEVVVSDVRSSQTINVTIKNTIKDLLAASILKLVDTITIPAGTKADTILNYLNNPDSTLDGEMTFILPAGLTNLIKIDGLKITVTNIHKSQDNFVQTLKVTLSQSGESLSKDIKIIFEGDKTPPTIELLTSADELAKPETEKTLSFKASDIGTGVDVNSIEVHSFLDPSKVYSLQPLDNGGYSFEVDKSDDYTITVQDYAKNETTAVYSINSIDKEAPTIEGVINNANYYLQHTIVIEDKNLKTVTIDGEEYTEFQTIDGVKTLKVTIKEHDTHTIVATDSANITTISFKISDLPSDLSERNEALKTMRDELIGQQTVLSEEEYNALDKEIAEKQSSINEGVINDFRTRFDNLKGTYPTISYSNRSGFDALLKDVNDGTKYFGKLTADMENKRDTLIDEINDYLKPLRDAESKVEELNKKLDQYNVLTVTSLQAAEIQHIKEELNKVNNDLLENGENNTVLGTAKAKIQKLEEAIGKLTEELNKLDEEIKAITIDNVKSSNKKLIESVIAKIQSYQITQGNRLSETDKLTLANKLDNANKLLERIKTVAKTVSDNKDIIMKISLDNVSQESYSSAVAARAKITDINTNLTELEIKSLEDLDKHIANLKNKLDLDSIADIDSPIRDLQVNSVNAESRETIQSVIDAINALINKSETTENQKIVLNEKLVKANDLINKLDEVMGEFDAVDKLTDLQTTNVNITHMDRINSADAKAKQVLTDYQNNLSPQQISDLEAISSQATILKAKIDEVTAIIETIKTASEISLDKVSADHLEQIDVALGAIDVIQGNLSHKQKTTVSGYGELLTKLKDKIGEVATYLTNLELLSQKQLSEVTTDIKTSMEEILKKDYTDLLTDSQKITVEKQKDLINGLLNQLSNIDEAIQAIETLLQGLEVTNIKTSDVSQLNEAKTLIDNFPYQEGILNAEQKNKYNTVATKVTALTERLDLVKGKLKTINDTLGSLTVDTVKTTDKERIISALNLIEELLTTYKDNLIIGPQQSDQLSAYKNTLIPALDAKIQQAEKEYQDLLDALKDLGIDIGQPKSRTYSLLKSTGLTVDIVTSSNLAEVKELIKKSQAILDNTASSDEQKLLATKSLEYANTLLERINTVQSQLGIVKETLTDKTEANVNSDSQSDIDKVNQAIEKLENDYTNNMTAEEKKTVDDKKALIEELENKLADVEVKINEIVDSLKPLTKDTVKDTDEKTLQDIQKTINEMKNNMKDNLSDSDKDRLDVCTSTINELEKKIEEVKLAIKDAEDSLSNKTTDNVVIDDKKDIQDVQDKIDKINTDYDGNLTEENQSVINKKQEIVTDLIHKVNVIESLIQKTEELKKSDFTNADVIQTVKDLLNNFDKLSDEQKVLFNTDQLDYYKDIIENGVVNSLVNQLGKVEGVDNTHFINGTTLIIKDVFNKLHQDLNTTVESNINIDFHGYKLIALYDVKLEYKAMLIQPNGKIKIVFALPSNIDQFDDIKAVYVDEEGNVIEYPFEIKDGYVYIETDHLSYYGIIAKEKIGISHETQQPEQQQPTKPNQSAQTHDNTTLELYALLGMISLAGWLTLKKRKAILK